MLPEVGSASAMAAAAAVEAARGTPQESSEALRQRWEIHWACL